MDIWDLNNFEVISYKVKVMTLYFLMGIWDLNNFEVISYKIKVIVIIKKIRLNRISFIFFV